MSYVNFTLSVNNKNQLRDLYNFEIRVIMAINNLDGSTLGDNLIQANKRRFQPKLFKMAKSTWSREHFAAIRYVVSRH